VAVPLPLFRWVTFPQAFYSAATMEHCGIICDVASGAIMYDGEGQVAKQPSILQTFSRG